MEFVILLENLWKMNDGYTHRKLDTPKWESDANVKKILYSFRKRNCKKKVRVIRTQYLGRRWSVYSDDTDLTVLRNIHVVWRGSGGGKEREKQTYRDKSL